MDLESGTARISRSFSSDKTLGPTKTGYERVVELSMCLCRVLAETQPAVFPIPEGTLVFSAQQGGYLRASNFRQRVFQKPVRAALGPGKHCSPHCLRHTWASLHMARATPLKWIQKQGSWATAKVLLDTYGHYMPSESHGYADAIAGQNGSMRVRPELADARLADATTPLTEGAQDSGDSAETTNPRSPIMHLSGRGNKNG